jgi:hypothetical protein
LDILWEVGRRAVYVNADLFSRDELLGIGESVEDSSSYVFDDALELDKLTLTREIGAPLVPGIGRDKGSIGGNDLIGEKPQEFCDFYQHMEDLVVALFS